MLQIPNEFGRAELVSFIERRNTVLEIGPFTNPVYRGKNVKYFDVLDKHGLLDRAARIGYPSENAVNIGVRTRAVQNRTRPLSTKGSIILVTI
ncbi:hypothetical protein [Phyllobacterium zundukense]|uniref:Uncharacterized protein n=1 Tax=Phyllobacterium zundukense TaxID=1867719 RepID=A0ACD4CZ59_9HYPH|nr:hypothetical protein [Phyllobacterium zundukense]UXN58750.1 hypothetical protein N8E88_12360 [Phyllobacterium zundukense]